MTPCFIQNDIITILFPKQAALEGLLVRGNNFSFSRCGALTYSGGAAPGTARADDHTVSTRSWETSVQHWRVGVKQWWQEKGRPYHLRKLDMVSSSLSVKALR